VAGVGSYLGGHQVGECPPTTAALRACLFLGSIFQRANRRFDGPIITRTRRRGVQGNYSGRLQELLERVGTEGRAVIHFQDEGRPVHSEQAGQRFARDLLKSRGNALLSREAEAK
jgi:hypothetical protein